MLIIRKAFTVIWKIYFALSFFLSLLLIYPLLNYYLSDEKRFYKAFKLTRWWAKYLLLSVGIRYKVLTKNALPKPPYIICSNHTSYLDLILLYAIFPDYFVMIAKKEILKVPLFSIYSRKNMNITVDRENRISSHKAFIKLADQLEKGNCVGIFPEGTISKVAPKLYPFKSGPFKLAIGKGVSIVPVTFLNNWSLLERGTIVNGRGGPGLSHIVIDKAIDTTTFGKEDAEVLMEKTYNLINWNISSYLKSKAL